jgi:peptide/nickel transport system substrate-binding protein
LISARRLDWWTARRVFAAGALALLLGTACSRANPSHGETLRAGFATEPHSLNPIDMQNGQEMVIDRLFSDPMTSFDSSGNRIVPILATRVPTRQNGDVSADGRTIVFHLRKGVKWQDGAPLTSADVAFTFAQVMNPANNVVSRFGYDDIRSLDTPDRYTVRLRLKRAFSPLVATFFGDANIPFGILPKHLLKHYASLEHIPYDALPVGSGPFRVVAWHRGDRLELDANPGYFQGRPHLRHITIFFSHSEQTLVTQAQAHEIDWAAELSPALAAGARSVARYHLVLVPQNRWYGITFNLTRPVLRDVRVRRAVELAIDKPAMARALTYGTALPATQDLPMFLWASPHLPPSPHDPKRARALLEQAGWSPKRPLHLELAYNSADQTARKAAVVIQSVLAGTGIELEPKGYPNELLTGPVSMGGILETGKFDLVLSRILNGPEPDNSAEYSCAGFPPKGFNFARYCEPEMETWQRVATSSYDRDERRAAYAHIEALLERDLPQIPLWWPRDIHLVSNRLRNFDPNPFVETWDAWRWSMR